VSITVLSDLHTKYEGGSEFVPSAISLKKVPEFVTSRMANHNPPA